MTFSDIQVFLKNFDEEMGILERKFKENTERNLFKCYVPMSDNIRKKARAYVLPLLKELELLSMKYGEKYKMKDIEFHIRHTSDHVNFIKESMKELLDLYESQADYEIISRKWRDLFTNISRRKRLINSRLMLIEKILNNEF